MQNRLTLTGIPSFVFSLPNAAESLRELVEENGCWIDRFAFLPNNSTVLKDDKEQEVVSSSTCKRKRKNPQMMKDTVIAVIEFHIENVRDKAVRSLDGMHIKLDSRGNLDSSPSDPHFGQKDKVNCAEDDALSSFTIRAFPATVLQSKLLVENCPINDELEDTESNSIMESQVMTLPNAIEMIIKRSENGGGTGENPWRGGIILAQHIGSWLEKRSVSIFGHDAFQSKSGNIVTGKDLFDEKHVLELGAGSAGLPSIALAKCCERYGITLKQVASDGIDEIVLALKNNVAINQLDEKIRVMNLDWNHLPLITSSSNAHIVDTVVPADTIIFADCVYNEEGAEALSDAIDRLLKYGGHVIGVLPDFRVGLDHFEKLMIAKLFIPKVVPRISESTHVPSSKLQSVRSTFLCAGGGGKDYRLLHWQCNRRLEDKVGKHVRLD